MTKGQYYFNFICRKCGKENCLIEEVEIERKGSEDTTLFPSVLECDKCLYKESSLSMVRAKSLHYDLQLKCSCNRYYQLLSSNIVFDEEKDLYFLGIFSGAACPYCKVKSDI